MRTDNDNFTQVNKASSKEFCFVIEVAFDAAGTDLVYFTSSSSASTPPAATVIESTIADNGISGTTQKINPDTSVSSIGNINFNPVDVAGAVTAKIFEKLSALKGLNGKRARFYIGAPSLVWDDYILFQTQIIQDIRYKDTVYKFSCSDVQRSMRKQIFSLAKTNLSANAGADDTTINVYATSDFTTVAHGSSYSDSPSATVGYIKIENGDSFEILKWTSKSATTFTISQRGALGTKALEFETTADAENGIEVSEYVYLEMPAPKLQYALLTGKLYGQAGEELPASWHLGIDEQYIRTADFLLIGLDYWDTANDSAGLQVRFEGLAETDGKRFIERELMVLMGAFSPIYSNGELGLKRLVSVLSSDPTVLNIDESNVVGHGGLQHDLKSIKNNYLIHWNYSAAKERFTRQAYLFDPASQTAHGVSDLVILSFRGLHGSKHSYDSIQGRFDALRDRYSGPPLKIVVTVKPSLNDLEVGDLVFLALDSLQDINTGQSIARAFEIQQTAIDWDTGDVKLTLFGSSQKATIAPPSETGTDTPDSFYTSEGSDLEAAFPAETSRAGDIVTINSDINLTAGADLGASGSIYYADGDLVVASGVTVTLNKSIQLRVNGVLTVNGTADGVGNGGAGGPGGTETHRLAGGAFTLAGEQGYIGRELNQQGYANCFEYLGVKRIVSWYRQSFPVGSDVAAVPVLNLSYNSGIISGLPTRLYGSGGTGGAGVGVSDNGFWTGFSIVANGGDAGAGGAGLFIVCKGMDFGVSGKIDLSGDPSAENQVLYANGYNAWAGAGSGGHPGALIVLLDGVSSNYPGINSSTFIANIGESKHKGVLIPDTRNHPSMIEASATEYSNGFFVGVAQPVKPEGSRWFSDTTQARWPSCYQVQYLVGQFEAVEDEPEEADRPLTLTLNELLNTPPTPAGDQSTVEITVGPPSDTNYSYSIIDYKRSGEDGWTIVGAADDETIKTLTTDGGDFIFRARAVSKTGVTSSTGITQTITLTDITGGTDIDTALPVPDVTGLALLEGGIEFGGTANFTWNKTSIYQLSAHSTGTLDVYFKHHRIQILDPNNGDSLIREEFVFDNHYSYTLNKNAADYSIINSAVGSYASVKIRIKQVSVYDTESTNWIALTVSDPPPPDLDQFLVAEQPDGTREFSFVYSNKPFDHAGIEIRFKTGSYSDWDTMDKLQDGLITVSPWENNLLAKGAYTFAAKPVDRSGKYSINALFITTNLGDPRSPGSIIILTAGNNDWPGTKTNCTINSNGDLIANDQNTWSNLTTWTAWTKWYQNPYTTIIYEHPVYDIGIKTRFKPVVSAYGDGAATVEERHSDDNATYSAWAAATGTEVNARYLQIRVTLVNTTTLTSLRSLSIDLTARVITEDIEDLDTSALTQINGEAGHIKIPVANSFAVIKGVNITLQNTGGGWSVELISKSDTTNGPEIRIYNASIVGANATIDATIRGL